MKILAVDYGEKRVGFAIGATLTRTATPIDPLDRKSNDQVIGYIRELIAEYDIAEVIVGYPLNMDGTVSESARRVEHFAARIRNKLQLPVQLVDERLTSFEAEEILKAHLPDFRKRKKILDSVSAAVLLQSHLESGLRNEAD